MREAREHGAGLEDGRFKLTYCRRDAGIGQPTRGLCQVKTKKAGYQSVRR